MASAQSALHAITVTFHDSRTPMPIDKHHLLPNHHPAPLYATVPMAEYQALQKKLDICQKECIRIAELYQRDKQLFNTKIQRIIRHINEAKRNY
jgi:hypothetical protein